MEYKTKNNHIENTSADRESRTRLAEAEERIRELEAKVESLNEKLSASQSRARRCKGDFSWLAMA